MSLEILSTAAAIGTFAVIAATAIAAVIQLRHLRASNQLQGLLNVVARAEDSKFNEWIDGSRHIISENLPDPGYRRRIQEGTIERSENPWLNLANSYEWMGSLIRQGLIAEEPFMDVHAARVISAWQLVEEIIAPHGVYPKTTPRARLNDKWLAADAA